MNGTINLPRSVMEQTIEAMRRSGEQRGSTASEFNAIEALRAALEQPQVEQEPVTARHRFRNPQRGTPDWSVWQPCKVEKRPVWEIDSQGFEVEYQALYTHPHPPRQPLTDEQQIAEAMRRHGLVLVKTVNGYDVLELGQITTHKIGGDA